MTRYFWIIIVLMGVWQLIGSLAERTTKKQQDQRVKDLTALRRRQEMAAQRGGGERIAAGVPPTGPVVADRAGELAARRKAQLDELRGRRAVRTEQPATRPKASPATLRPTQPSFRPPAPAPAPAARPQPVPVAVLRKPASKPQARPAETTPARRLQPLERSADDSVHRLVPTRKVVEAKGPRLLSLPGLGEVPVDRALLRRMMLYHEILEPPVALRERQDWER